LTANICILDFNQIIIAVNKTWCNFANSNPPVIKDYGIGVNYLNLCDSAYGAYSEEARKFAEGIRLVLNGTHSTFALEYPCNSPHEERWFIGRVTLLLNSNPAQVVISHENITERKRDEVLIKKYAEELKEANSGKDRLFAFISHDLKDTFHGLLGISDLLENNLGNMEDHDVKKIGMELNKTVKDQYKQLENLLTWSKIQLGKVENSSASFNLKEIADENLAILKNSYVQKKIIVSNKIEDIWIIEDPTILNSIFQNLIINAIKFTGISGKITLYSQTRSDCLEIIVQDTGIGISEDNIQKLFNISTHFTLAGTNGEAGSGLGLLICKEMVMKMGGNLTVTSKYREGSKFTFSIPIEKVVVSKVIHTEENGKV
jgi:signal transduction histidine kinase